MSKSVKAPVSLTRRYRGFHEKRDKKMKRRDKIIDLYSYYTTARKQLQGGFN